MKNKELVINVYDEIGSDGQDVIFVAFEKYLEIKLKKPISNTLPNLHQKIFVHQTFAEYY